MGIAAILAFNVGLLADDVRQSNNPYAPAVARNIFGLNPLVFPTEPQPVEPLVKITPTGTTSIFGRAQVLFKVTSKTDKEASYIFAEGQEKVGIKVIKIDEEKGLVIFDNHGSIQELALCGAPAANVEAVNFQR